MDHRKVKMTIAERENLMTDCLPHSSGFTPRSIHSLTTRHRPHSMTDIECCHFLRTPTQEFTNQQSSIEHRLWVEAGKTAAPSPTYPDPSYNSNLWRNFRRHFKISFSGHGKMTEAAAAFYPINIPPPSRIGDNTFDKYLKETNLIRNEKFKSLAIRRAATEIDEFRKLQCKTFARNPPINEKGDILPPENYKKYAHRFIPQLSPPPSPHPPGQKPDIFGRLYTPRSSPALWKLSYKLNHPCFQKLQEEIRTEHQIAEGLRKIQTHRNPPPTLPTPLSYTSLDGCFITDN